MDRREFLKDTTALFSAPLVRSGDYSESVMPALPSSVHIHEQYITSDSVSICRIRKAIASGDYNFLDTHNIDFYSRYYDDAGENPAWDSAWFLWASRGQTRWMLDSCENEGRLPGADRDGFESWLSIFRPRNCNDWLMVPTIYEQHVSNSDFVEWRSSPVLREDDHLDSLLSTSRGILLWRHQLQQLIADACNISYIESSELTRNYCRRQPDAVSRIDETPFRSQLLGDIIQERAIYGKFGIFTPNYMLAGFLSEYILMEQVLQR